MTLTILTPRTAITRFLKDETGAITVDWTALTATAVGMGLATAAVVTDGVSDLSNDITNMLTGIELSSSFRDIVETACIQAGAGTEAGRGGPTGDTHNGNPINALLIYQASDFVGGLPDERNWRAEGASPHPLTVADDAQPQVMFISDNDDYLHENDDDQRLAQALHLNGETYDEGFEVSSGYTISDEESGIIASGLHFANQWNGQMQGPVFATAASTPLEPGQTYTFSDNVTTHNNERPYSDYLGCA